MKKIKTIDLFAGIGGIRKGFELAFGKNNIKNIFTSEFDNFARQTYLANWPNEKIYGDITDLKSDKIDTTIGSHDILLAGFPCQPFSQAGLKRGVKDSRGTLFFDIERILRIKRPKVLLLENVKALTYLPMKDTFKMMLSILDDIGYKVFSKVLRARDFGVPQNRERIYIVGIKKSSFENIDFEFPTPIETEVTVGDILETKVNEKYTISDKLWEGHKRRKENNKKNGKGFGYGLFNENSSYTNTLSARYYKDGSEILIEQKNKNPRRLTPLECKRLQGFPDDYKLPFNKISDAQLYKQFGNSVAVPVIECIATKLKTFFK